MELIFSFDYDCAQEAELSESKTLCSLINGLIGTSLHEKPYLLVLNPKSGVQKALKIYQNCISDIFDSENIKFLLMMTETALHAFNFIKSCTNLNDYRGIVTVSGDGLIYEIFCGIMERPSWKEDLASIPIGTIAAGSGNGLAASISAFSGINPMENLTLQNILLLKNPQIQSLDLMRLQTSEGKEIPAFLSVTWGLIANIDVGSDNMRWMGPSRFNVAAVIQIAKLKKFKAKLWYLPTIDCCSTTANKATANSKINAHQIEPVVICNDQKGGVGIGPQSMSSVEHFKHLPNITVPIPDDGNWVLVDDKFVGIMATLLPYIAANACVVPDATLNDGKIRLIIMHSTLTRLELLSFISKIETGQRIHNKSITIIECSAFRLVTENDKCLMAVDGEMLHSCSIQGEIMPSVANIFTGLNSEGIRLI